MTEIRITSAERCNDCNFPVQLRFFFKSLFFSFLQQIKAILTMHIVVISHNNPFSYLFLLWNTDKQQRRREKQIEARLQNAVKDLICLTLIGCWLVRADRAVNRTILVSSAQLILASLQWPINRPFSRQPYWRHEIEDLINDNWLRLSSM